MSEKIKLIAKRIKELRKISGLSAEAVAADLKIPTDLYRNYENGVVDIPVSFLYEISRKFNVELTVLLTGDEPRLHTYCLVKNGTGPFVDRRKDYKYRDLAYNFIQKKAEVFQVNVDPKPESSSAHFNSHPGQEFNYVLKGTLKVILDDHEVILEEGDSLFFNSGLKHAMVAQNKKPVKFLAVIL
jgi:quercetin dioxygenase-like cupin family protein